MLTPQELCEKIPALAHREDLTHEDTFLVARDDLVATITTLKDELNYKGLLDLTLAEFPEEILGIYVLMDLDTMHMITLEVPVPLDSLHLPTLSGIFPAANHLEREAWEMFGVDYQGHPNLKRLLLADDFVGFPLRKDYTHKTRV